MVYGPENRNYGREMPRRTPSPVPSNTSQPRSHPYEVQQPLLVIASSTSVPILVLPKQQQQQQLEEIAVHWIPTSSQHLQQHIVKILLIFQ
jgi:hypothetical protein